MTGGGGTVAAAQEDHRRALPRPSRPGSRGDTTEKQFSLTDPVVLAQPNPDITGISSMKRRHRLALVIESSHEVHDCLGKVPLDLPNDEAMAGCDRAEIDAVPTL